MYENEWVYSRNVSLVNDSMLYVKGSVYFTTLAFLYFSYFVWLHIADILFS